MPSPRHPMLPFLVDLESEYTPDATRQYDPADLVAFALSYPASDYWPSVVLAWLEQGVPSSGLRGQLSAFEGIGNEAKRCAIAPGECCVTWHLEHPDQTL